MSDMVETRGSARKEKLTVHSDEEESNVVEDKVADEEEYSSLKGSSDSEDKVIFEFKKRKKSEGKWSNRNYDCACRGLNKKKAGMREKRR